VRTFVAGAGILESERGFLGHDLARDEVRHVVVREGDPEIGDGGAAAGTAFRPSEASQASIAASERTAGAQRRPHRIARPAVPTSDRRFRDGFAAKRYERSHAIATRSDLSKHPRNESESKWTLRSEAPEGNLPE
jgi:hypothetical protein